MQKKKQKKLVQFFFNPDRNKEAQDAIYSRKTKKNHHLPTFSKSTVSQITS